ncbi:hypothetical protein [Pseudomonas sp. R11-23-07]|uniref:hypothetical protein n=1 Tax=Pseudomonas sp. R11-23-07 TaxID=658632 RepID=UPI000F574C7D|nr:hypothetical protein [Pseudomonas sp. R11-23-07]AZF60350.1 hypothetical protein C4J84_4511 [Pseudomonas sp. R11-23-07]
MTDRNKLPLDSFFSNIPRGLADTIQWQYEKLQELSLAVNDSENLDEYLDKLTQEIESGDVTQDTLADIHVDSLFTKNVRVFYQAQLKKSCVAFIHARKKVHKIQETAVWPLLCHASYLIAVAESAAGVVYQEQEAQRVLKNGEPGRQKGGKKTSELYRPIRDRMIELLREIKPTGGWRTKKQAIDAIHGELEVFISNTPELTVAIPDVYSTADKWLKSGGNLEIIEAYNANAATVKN